MPPLILKSEVRARRGARPKWLLVVWVLVALVGALAVERWRGQRALRTWLEEHAARGERFELVSLWPKPDEQARRFTIQLSQAARQLPKELTAFSGLLSAMVPDGPGFARRGSHEPQPSGVQGKSWRELDAAVSNASTELKHLRLVMKEVPASMGDDIVKRMETGDMPAFVGARVSAQTLHAVAIHDLHRGDLPGALENLLALAASVRLFADEPTLVNYMVRVAIAGLSVDAYWDALQATGWTDEQLAQLQNAMKGFPTPEEMPRVIQAERAARLASWDWFQSHSYYAWIDRYQEIAKGFGVTFPDTVTAGLSRKWQQWGFHPLWQFAWADQEKVEYLEHSEKVIAAVREASRLQNWRPLEVRLKTLERDYRPPAARWRFYRRLPVYDDTFLVVGSSRPNEQTCPHPSYFRAWQVAFRNLTQIQMVNAAIALKRHALRHGKYPPTLDGLVPEILSAAPRDLMNGQTLRYRPNDDGTFLLYSVGDDARDDGGDPYPGSTKHDNSVTPWNGSDWVWPQLVADDQSEE